MKNYLNMDQRLYIQETYNITKDYSPTFVLWCLERAIYNLGRKTEEKLKEFGDIKELLQIKNKKSLGENQYPVLSISELAKERYGFEISFDKRIVCPFHKGADNPTSFKFNDERNRFSCFSCGIKGNIVQFVKLMEEKVNGN